MGNAVFLCPPFLFRFVAIAVVCLGIVFPNVLERLCEDNRVQRYGYLYSKRKEMLKKCMILLEKPVLPDCLP